MSLKSLSYYIFLTQQRMCIGHGQPGCTASGSNGFFSSKLLKCIPENQKKTICHPGTFVSVTTKNSTDLNRWKHETQSNSMQNFPSIAWPKSISNRPISQPSIQRKNSNLSMRTRTTERFENFYRFLTRFTTPIIDRKAYDLIGTLREISPIKYWPI